MLMCMINYSTVTGFSSHKNGCPSQKGFAIAYNMIWTLPRITYYSNIYTHSHINQSGNLNHRVQSRNSYILLYSNPFLLYIKRDESRNERFSMPHNFLISERLSSSAKYIVMDNKYIQFQCSVVKF